MVRINLTPIIRGAFLDALGAPVVLVSESDENAKLPELGLSGPGALWRGHGSAPAGAFDADSGSGGYAPEERAAEAEIGRQARQAMAALRDAEGSVPAAVRVPGYGSFFAGFTREDADRARAGEIERLDPPVAGGRDAVVRGRIALVTGGAQGFGAEIVRGLVDAGAFVFVADINLAGAEAFVAELNADGVPRAAAVAADVADEDSVRAMAMAIVAEAGGLDLLISNAGVQIGRAHV